LNSESAGNVMKKDVLYDVTYFGVKLVVGSIFIFHGIQKFSPEISGMFSNFGIPAEMQIPIALAELISGILLIIGVLNRISASLLAIIMLGAIFYVKRVASFSGMMGVEFDLMLLASILLIIVAGPRRLSMSHIIKKIPKYLQ